MLMLLFWSASNLLNLLIVLFFRLLFDLLLKLLNVLLNIEREVIKLKFYSSFNPAPSVSEVQCPKTLQNYCFNSVTRKLEKTDTIPFYEEIQSYYESTKLSTKLTRYTMGDVTALGFESGAFGDFSGQNTNLATVLNTNQIAKSEFDKLPQDIRRIFNYNFTDFIRSVEDGSYEQKLTSYAKSKSDEIAKSKSDGIAKSKSDGIANSGNNDE